MIYKIALAIFLLYNKNWVRCILKKKLTVVIIMVLTVFLISIFVLLKNNKTFFSSIYVGVNNQEIFIPRYSYFKSECCMTAATFYSLKSEKRLKDEINNYMNDFKYFSDDTTYGYKKGELFIQSYDVEDHLLYRKIIIVY